MIQKANPFIEWYLTIMRRYEANHWHITILFEQGNKQVYRILIGCFM